jgi:hypothetical protein
MDSVQYPIGQPEFPQLLTAEQRATAIRELTEAPDKLEAAVQGLTDNQLDTPYRPDGWTVRQVVHHLADTHSTGLLRIRMALTAVEPTVALYSINAIAELSDAKNGPIGPSLLLFRGAHQRLVLLLKSLQPEDFARPFRHPERGLMTVDRNVFVYAWHARHHTAHIANLRERQGW